MVFRNSSNSGEWKGVYVYSEILTPAKVDINHLNIFNTKRLESGLLDLTGAFSIYNADVKISNMNIESSKAEDGLNIRQIYSGN